MENRNGLFVDDPAQRARGVIERLGPEDAVVLAHEFQPKFDVDDLLNLSNRSVYLKLMIDGAPSQPFSARTLSCGSEYAILSA